MRSLRIFAAAAALSLPAAADAQGTVSAQGFGYPPGQLSTLGRGTGGGLGEFDPLSPLNPASVGGVPATSLFLHYAPESRRTTVASASDEATLVRFPVIGAVLTVGQRGAVGLSTSTFLDRTWTTTEAVGGTDDDAVRQSFESRGGINDVRLAGAYNFSRQLIAGVAGHVLTGSNRMSVSRIDPTGGEASFTSVSEITYNGTAASAGVIWSPLSQFSLAASGRVGGSVRAKAGDSTVATATAPARAAVSLRYTGITGAAIAARAVWDGWSSLDELGTERLSASDTREYGIGADVVGPRLLRSALALRVGARWRELPFAALGEQPTEQAVSGGIGAVLGANRVLLDLVVERARRSVNGARESAWVIGAGITVRP